MKHHKQSTAKVADLIPYSNNSRTHSEDQIQQIVSSIMEFGFTNPVLIDEEGMIIAGHGRVMAAEKLGAEEIPTIVLSGLTEAQKKAYVIADNQLPLNADWDLEKLKLEVEALSELEYDLNLLGFEDTFLLELRFDADELDYDLLDDDDAEDAANEISEAGKKAIQIEFDIQDYDEAAELVKWWRERTSIGQLVMALLQKAKDSHED